MTALRKCDGTFVETEIDTETVVMSLNSGEFFALKDTARYIWTMLDTAADRTGMLAALAAAYDAPEEMLARDLDAFLSDLLAAGLIEAA